MHMHIYTLRELDYIFKSLVFQTFLFFFFFEKWNIESRLSKVTVPYKGVLLHYCSETSNWSYYLTKKSLPFHWKVPFLRSFIDWLALVIAMEMVTPSLSLFHAIT